MACGSEEEATRVADALLDAHLAACVQVSGPVTSRYRWQGTMETATEWLAVAKSRLELVDRVAVEVRRVHAYELPEVVATPIVAGDPDYLRWLLDETPG